MLRETFLFCAMSLPATNFTRPPIASYHAMKTEEEQLRDLENWIKKNNPGAEVFIHENPQVERLKQDGWERTPINFKDKQIWIKRKPESDTWKALGSSA